MPEYRATFTFKLRNPIWTSEVGTLSLVRQPDSGIISLIRILAPIADGRIRALNVEVTYSAPNLEHWAQTGDKIDSGVIVVVAGERSQYILPHHDASGLISHLLYHLSGETLQAHVYWDILENLSENVADLTWQLPDGRHAPLIDIPMSRMLLDIRDAGDVSLSAQHWANLQDMFDGRTGGAPLWRNILAEAHRERGNDIRNVVVRCATALDVAVKPLLPTDKVFSMALLRGECSWARTPDLRTVDSGLYNVLAKLWYTRHGIVHKGQVGLYDRSPKNASVLPLRPLTGDDIIEFLQAVPKGVDFVLRNPP